MKSFIAALRSLVLPYGATSGARVILDGVNGRIEIYDAAGDRVGLIDSSGIWAIDTDGSYVRSFTEPGAAAVTKVQPATTVGRTWTPGTVYGTFTPDAEKHPIIGIESPVETGDSPAAIYVAGSGVVDPTRSITMDADVSQFVGDVSFTADTFGPILIDRTTGVPYRIFVDGGVLQIEVV